MKIIRGVPTDPQFQQEILDFVGIELTNRFRHHIPGFYQSFDHAPSGVKTRWSAGDIEVAALEQIDTVINNIIADIVKHNYRFFQRLPTVQPGAICKLIEPNGISLRISFQDSRLQPATLRIDWVGW